MPQSRVMSLVEAWTNVLVGFALAVIVQLIVFPWFGIYASFDENLKIGAIFTIVSLARSYCLRRLFNWL